MQYCPHCMKPATGTVCPNCGGDLGWTGQKGVDLPVGTVLSGGNGLRTYQIGAARGKGGFGITYIALEVNSGRRMAIKEYYPTSCAFRGGNGVDVQAMTGQENTFRSGMDSFLEEGRMLLAQDDLACVVHVIDYFQANGTAYLAMEYLDGVPLHTQMTRMGGRIPVNELMPRLAPLMRDIGQLHRRGVIHRDISPDNIMWMPDGGLKLLDFGSARSMQNGKSMTVLMKQGFSPIEQYSSKGQGPYTDIYALAATIYYCVTGVIPPSSMERVADDTLQSPIALGAVMSVQQETALLWALSIQPDARPRNMEEFAPMLCPESPVSAYSVPQGFQPSSERNAGYQPGHTEPIGPGQPVGPGQSVGPVQPAGPGQNQNGPGGKKGGGKKILPVLIGAGAAAVLLVGLLMGAIILWAIGSIGGIVEHSEGPSHTMRPTDPPSPGTTPPIEGSDGPSPTVAFGQNGFIGVTDDGFRYEIIGDHVVLTGYVEGAEFYSMPDEVHGVPITEIADGAFAGASTGSTILLPISLETIGANAFRGCTDLMYLVAYSDVATDSSSFSGCSNLWCVSVRDTAASGWKLPSGVGLYYKGMETGYGALRDIHQSGGVLTGETDRGKTVLLDVIPGMNTVSGLDNVDWICPWALDNLSYGATINVGDNTVYPYEVFCMPFSWSAPDGTFADQWLLSCAVASDINDARPSGAPRIEPDLGLMQAAMTLGEEYSQDRDSAYRADGTRRWSTALTDCGVSYSKPAAALGTKTVYSDAWTRAREYSMEKYISALTQEDSSTYAGQYYSRVGAAVTEYEGKYVWWVVVTIP